MLDPAAAGMMQMIGHWPNINEDDMRAEATAIRNTAATALTSATQAETAVRGAQQNYRGGAAEALQTQWNRLGVSGGSLAQAGQALNVAPVGLEGAASVVSAVKVVSGMQAAATAVTVAKLLAFGGAAGASLAVARMRLAQTELRKAQVEGMEITGKRLGEVIVKKLKEPMRRILDDLPRRGGGPAGRRAGAGPVRAAGRHAP
ncbi:WXG100-like domain-containing protein, partial [Nonomuraea sp. NPDC003201]